MALFKRADLKEKGFSDEQIDYIMTEGNRSLAANYTLTSDVQSRIDEAVKAAKPEAVNVTESAEYQEIARERDMLRAIGGDDFAAIKPKFRETVYGMLDRGEQAKPIPDQLNGIKEKFDEYFISADTRKPEFGTPDKGKMPTGDQGNAAKITDVWGFAPKK